MTKIFITGATGFVGRNLYKRLATNKSFKICVHVRNKKNNEFYKDATIINSDLVDLLSVESLICEFNPDICIHLGWIGVLNNLRNDPIQLQNIGATVSLIQILSKTVCKYFIGFGSQAEYGIKNSKIIESDTLNPTSLYGLTKVATYDLLVKLCQFYNIKMSWIRLFSSYGPDNSKSWFLSYLIDSLRNGISPRVTKAEQMWDYIHIDDVCDAVQRFINIQPQGYYNLGFGKAEPLKKIIEYVKNNINKKIKIHYGAVKYRPDQVMYLEADVTKISKALDWAPKINIYDGLKKDFLVNDNYQ